MWNLYLNRLKLGDNFSAPTYRAGFRNCFAPSLTGIASILNYKSLTVRVDSLVDGEPVSTTPCAGT